MHNDSVSHTALSFGALNFTQTLSLSASLLVLLSQLLVRLEFKLLEIQKMRKARSKVSPVGKISKIATIDFSSSPAPGTKKAKSLQRIH